MPSVLARTSSTPLSVAEAMRVRAGLRAGSVPPLGSSALPESLHTLGSLGDQTCSLRSAVSDPRRTPPRKPTASAWAGLLLGPRRSLTCICCSASCILGVRCAHHPSSCAAEILSVRVRRAGTPRRCPERCNRGAVPLRHGAPRRLRCILLQEPQFPPEAWSPWLRIR